MLGEIMTMLLSLFGDHVWFKNMCIDAKLTKGGLMIVNFMCQLEWAIGCPE